jgi:hypothetical protein
MARDFMARHGDLAGGVDASELETITVLDHGGVTFVTMQPTFRGVPILGAQVVVSTQGSVIRHRLARSGLGMLSGEVTA